VKCPQVNNGNGVALPVRDVGVLSRTVPSAGFASENTTIRRPPAGEGGLR
jgi:hypothetical protein